MKKGLYYLLIVLVIFAVSGFFVYKKIDTKEKINDTVLELSTKKAIIQIANKEFEIEDIGVVSYAEGHKILGYEIKNDKINAYVVAEYGVYNINDKTPMSASASAIKLIFSKNEIEGYYNLVDYKIPEDGKNYEKTLKEIFPENLIKDATAANYSDKFYQEQIQSYLQVTSDDNDKIQTLLKDVMNNKKEFTTENNKEVLLKDFVIIDDEKAQVDKYATVDMDSDGIEELIILTTSEYGSYVVLHYENGIIYGYKIGIRSLESLKKDGTFIGSSGATSNEYLTMSFDKNKYKTTAFAIYDTVNNVYEVEGKKVSEEFAKEYTDKWAERESVEWNTNQ